MYASITTTDPEPYVKARIVDSQAGEVQLTLGHRATLFLSPHGVSALTAALQTAVAHMTTAEVAGAR